MHTDVLWGKDLRFPLKMAGFENKVWLSRRKGRFFSEALLMQGQSLF
jgi:hypothetical protein